LCRQTLHLLLEPFTILFQRLGSNVAAREAAYVYSMLVVLKTFNRSKGEKISVGVEPDGAESYEVSPDGTQLTFKLRPNLKFDPRPPTNGRTVNAQDVVATWEKFKAASRLRGMFANEISKNAPIASLTAPDSQTIVMKLAFPAVYLLGFLGYDLNFKIHPKEEFEGAYDQRNTMRGSGAWMQTNYQASQAFEYRKNPNYWRKDLPYLDGIDRPIILEYASGLSQFKAGRIAWYTELRNEDVLPSKKDLSALVMLQNDGFPLGNERSMYMDFRPNSPWLDERLRKSLSMLIDRDLYIDTFYNVAEYASSGIQVEKRWYSHISAGQEDYWTDPRSKDIGEGGKFFQYDPAEAKKLLKATGRDRMEADWVVVAGNEFGIPYHREQEVMRGMLEQSGDFKFNVKALDYSSEFNLRVSRGTRPTGGHNYEGVVFNTVGSFSGDVSDLFASHLLPGGEFYKFEENYPADERWYSLMTQANQEFDLQKRASIVKEWQRLTASKMYFIPKPGAGLGYNLQWPWIANRGVFVTKGGAAQTTFLRLWLDQSKKTS